MGISNTEWVHIPKMSKCNCTVNSVMGFKDRFKSCLDYKWLVTVNGFTVGRYVSRNTLGGFETHINLKQINSGELELVH